MRPFIFEVLVILKKHLENRLHFLSFTKRPFLWEWPFLFIVD